MAANNYFGFTHSGAQYAPTGAAPYQTTQPGYAVAPSAAAAAASYPQRAAPTGYDTAYPAAAAAATHTQPGPYAAVQAGSTAPTATYDYAGYAVARSAQPAYDTTKTYYQQQAPAAASYTSTDYPGGGGGGKPQYGGGSGSYSSQAAGAGRGVSAGGGGSAAAAVAAQKAAAAAAVAYSGGAAYAAVQQPSSGGGAGGGYASTAYGSQQQSSQQGKLIGSSLHRNLSSVAEYAQPSQQRSVQTFAPKQVKKPFHAQSSNAVVTTVTMPAAGSVAAVTSYQSVGNQPANNYSNSQQTTQNSYTAQVQQNTAFTAAAKPKTGGAIVISKPAAATYTNYDAALYSAATMYVAQQAGGGGGGGKSGNTWQGGGVGGYKKMGGGNMSKPVRQKLPPKPQQLHYCDVCKISCAGPQTYKEHLEGQKHKKKEASMKAGGATPSSTRGANALRCELCDVTCTGSDAYAAHIRGAKHQKVVKLHTKLGKPIPAVDPKAGPAVLAAAGATAVKSETTIVATKINFVAAGNLGTVKTELASSSATPAASAVATCGRGVSSATSNNSQSAAAAAIPVAAAVAASAADNEDSSAASAAAVKTDDVEMAVSATDNITPVGHEYIEEILNDEGKPISFNCKLCECKFNDPNAKLMHMKGRRHRLQFKKKVNPDLVVDVKTSLRQRRIQEEKQRKQAMRDDYFRRREEERMMEVEERMYWEERRRYEEEMEYYEWYNNRRHHGPRGAMGPPPPPPLPPPPPPYGPPPPAVMAGPPGPGGPKSFFPGGVGSLAPPLHLGGPGGHIRRLDTTNDDRHVIARHAAIYPKETELQAVQKIVSHVEKALKLVSDHLADTSKATASATGVGGGTKGAAPATPTKGGGKNAALPLAARNAAKKEAAEGRAGNLFSFQREKEEANSSRVLKGVMRVGVLAKGLLLAGDTDTQLVMLCADKPTRSLLAKVAANLPAQLKSVAADETYTVVGKPDEAAIVIATGSDPKMSVTVTLTSPVVREQLIARTADGGQGGTAADMTSQPPGGGGARGVDPPDLLNKAKCLEGLAALRHAKWFQARVNGLQSCVMVIRILRDLCIRNPTWAPLNSWAMELLAEKVVSSAGRPISVATALRRIMEALASGLLLAPHGPGLLDPCEKEPTDAAASLTAQQREDITASAQHALRLMAFRQIHKVLGMEMLQPPAKFRSGGSGGGGQRGFARKRRRDNSTGEGNESEAGDGKKDKKDDTATVSVKMEK